MKDLLFACAGVLLSAAALAAEVKVDFGRTLGPVKPVNGVGQPPRQGNIRYLRDAHVPYSRLHDVGGKYGGMVFVDIPNIFRDFDADENDPKSYDFAYTDDLLKALVDAGIEPFYRLGVTIDNDAKHGFPAYHVDPPKDFAKWGRICERVIRHYTEGWAGGYRWKIEYWEIWNEPENHPDPKLNSMFRAPFSEYMRLYGTVAPYLKTKFPHLKIGGYGSCGFYAGVGAKHVAAANSSPRLQHFVTCAREFLAAARENGWPLDFFSYHSYSDPKEAMRQVRFADALLDEFGFTREKCARVYNEWLPYVSQENLGSALQAAGVAAELVGLQNGPCDVACLYDARVGIGPYAPLFDPLTYKPHKAYYAFTAFDELRQRGTAVAADVTGAEDVYAAAADGADGAAVMLANDSDSDVPLACDFGGRRVLEVRLTDKTRTDAKVALPEALPPRSFCVVLLSPGKERGK